MSAQKPNEALSGNSGQCLLDASLWTPIHAMPTFWTKMSDDVIITPIPSLVATLLNKERAKGAALTREEVEDIRDQAPCVALTPDQRTTVDQRRGYPDIDPEHAWEDWQIARIELESEDV